jgi:hypothetical protein
MAKRVQVEIEDVLTPEELAWVETKLAQIAELEELMSDGLSERPIPMADAIRLGLVRKEALN